MQIANSLTWRDIFQVSLKCGGLARFGLLLTLDTLEVNSAAEFAGQMGK